jgi:hypothetical protein
VAQALVHADRDGEADAHLPADRDDLRGIEATIGPHRELSARARFADPADRLGQEVGRAPDGVGTTLAQAGHEDVARPGRHREQGVIAPDPGVPVVDGALFSESL